MLKFDRIDVSEGTDINKTSKSKECMLCHLLSDHIFYCVPIYYKK